MENELQLVLMQISFSKNEVNFPHIKHTGENEKLKILENKLSAAILVENELQLAVMQVSFSEKIQVHYA